MALREAPGSAPSIANEVRESDAAVAIAEEGEAAVGGGAALEGRHTREVPDSVLGQALGPAANDRKTGLGERAKDAGELLPGELGELIVRDRGLKQSFGSTAPEERSEKAASSRRAVRKLLVDEGAGKQMPVRRCRDKEAEAGRKIDRLRVREGKSDHDSGARVHAHEVGSSGVKGADQITGDLRGGGEQDGVEEPRPRVL